MKLLTPTENPVVVLPLHEGATSQEVAGKLAGTKHCAVGLARIQPGGGSEIDVHPHSEQVFYVLQGTLSLRNREQGEIVARPGEAIYVAPGDPHAARNPGTEETLCVVVTAPPLG
jgi:quercetin dioxygenase-like cupin family protein